MRGWGGVFLAGVAMGPLLDAWITGRLAAMGLGRPKVWRPATRWILIAALGGGGSLAWLTVGWSGVLPAHLVWVTVTAALAVTDLEHKLIPNRILYPGAVLTAALLGAGAFWDGTPDRLGGAFLSAALCLLAMAGLTVVARGAMGMGDVKLSALLGLICGYQGIEVGLRAILCGFLIGGAAAVALLVAGRAHRRTEIPFAPALVAGAWVSLLGVPF